MNPLRRSLVVLIPVLALLGACGGGDDDESGDGGDAPPGTSSSATSTTSAGSTSSGSDTDIPEIKDGSFADGDLHIEVSGDKDFTLDLEGNAFVAGGFALLTFGNDKATATLAFQAGDEEPGGISLTTEEIATAAEWGADCSVTLEDTETELKGKFTCEEVDGVQPGSVNAYKVRMSGNFSLSR